MKLKIQSKTMLKGKKQSNTLKIKKINQQIDYKKLINFFIKKSSKFFNLKDKNASLGVKII